jgi:alpha-tubulin suppressor-like RCC1 family protein
VVAIDAGDRHSVALKDDQTVWTWGTDMWGSLGLGSDSAGSYNLPQQVVDLDGVTSIAAGKFHTLALKEDGGVSAWGDNQDGALGDNSFEESYAPVNVRGENGRILSEVNSIAAGDGMSLAVKNDGTVLSWGWLNQDPESGEIIKLPFAVPVYNADKTPLSGVRQISAGFNHVLAVNNDGTVTSWGFNWDGALGNGTTSENYTPPAKVPNLSGIKAVTAGSRYSLARTTSGRVYTWGSNKAGQLGDGTNNSRTRPVQVPNLTGVFSISASKHNNDVLHSLAQ